MIGDRIGEMVWKGVVAKLRASIDYWLIAVSVVFFILAIWIGGSQ